MNGTQADGEALGATLDTIELEVEDGVGVVGLELLGAVEAVDELSELEERLEIWLALLEVDCDDDIDTLEDDVTDEKEEVATDDDEDT